MKLFIIFYQYLKFVIFIMVIFNIDIIHSEEIKSKYNNNLKKNWFIGVSIPFQGFGIYENPENSVLVWNLTPISFERAFNNFSTTRLSVYTVYSTPVPMQIKEFELNLEFPFYFFQSKKMVPTGVYLGPVFMLQLFDQDTGASLGGAGITLGYKGAFTSDIWYRTGLYAAYHTYVFGPKEKLRNLVGPGLSGGLFMGLTIFEIGLAF